MPALFGRHLLSKAVFLSLSEVADNLPAFEEECIPVQMDSETQGEYKKVAQREWYHKGNGTILGSLAQTSPFDLRFRSSYRAAGRGA